MSDATLATPGCAAGTAGSTVLVMRGPGVMTEGGGIADEAAEREGIVTTAGKMKGK